MKEDFIQYIWRFQQFNPLDLKTTRGEPLQIIRPGKLNRDGGPDFLEARIKIGDTEWAGNVEIHLRTSDWLKHHHHHDPAYENVILHVVLEEDLTIVYQEGACIPCLELRRHIRPGLAAAYEQLQAAKGWVPCHSFLPDYLDARFNLWLDRLLVERLERKTTEMEQRLLELKMDWEACFYEQLLRGFGLRVNAEPAHVLARTLPLGILRKHKNRLLEIEALLFGQAGFLEETFEDDYPRILQQEYAFLRKKYDLHPLQRKSWKFLRMRPANFPTIRLAQFAQLFYQSEHLWSKLLSTSDIREIEQAFSLKLSNYWQEHFFFDKASIRSAKSLGKARIHGLITNVLAPMVFLYGKYRSEVRFQDRALGWLEQLPAEKNKISRGWEKIGVKAKSAYESQALLQLKDQYCDRKQCLDCAVGNQMLRGAEAFEYDQTTRSAVRPPEVQEVSFQAEYHQLAVANE